MRIALNPIQWMASADGWLDPSLAPEPEKLLALVKQAGFNAIMAEVPAGWSVNQYRDAVDTLGLELAPGYFVCRPNAPSSEVLEKAAAVARQQAALGLTDIGMGLSMMGKEAPRVLNPARGHDQDDARLATVTKLVAQVADTIRSEGLRPARLQDEYPVPITEPTYATHET